MTREQSIIKLGSWLHTAPGRLLLAWEQDRLDHAVTDAFGFHALQLGLPEIEALRANRMPHRWVAGDTLYQPEALPGPPPLDDQFTTQAALEPVALHCEFDALPFPNASIDLVVMPHTLELARDPH
ncbi:MAG: SAM-dependent methyltransferase, partial [Rubrivivax sp.]|nr:SAM-dependent methyltransferase [Rubrivivax sp.]